MPTINYDTIIIVDQTNVSFGGSGGQTNVVNIGQGGAGGLGAAAPANPASGGMICTPALAPTFSLFDTALCR